VLEFVESHPYDVFKLLPRKLLPIDRYDIRLENFHNANYVLISRHSTMRMSQVESDKTRGHSRSLERL
jgi:hypothetical protein